MGVYKSRNQECLRIAEGRNRWQSEWILDYFGAISHSQPILRVLSMEVRARGGIVGHRVKPLLVVPTSRVRVLVPVQATLCIQCSVSANTPGDSRCWPKCLGRQGGTPK